MGRRHLPANKLKYVRNKMCIKTTINAQLKKFITRLKNQLLAKSNNNKCNTIFVQWHCKQFTVKVSLHSFVHAFNHAFNHAFIRSWYSLIHSSIHPSIHPFSHSSIHPSIHPFTHSSIHSLSSIHPFMSQSHHHLLLTVYCRCLFVV